MTRKRKRRLKRQLLLIGAVAVFLIAFCLVLYPVIGNVMAETHKSMVLTEYQQLVDQIDSSEEAAELERAHAYNNELLQVTVSVDGIYTTDGLTEAGKNYADILNVNGQGLIGHIEIPKLSIFLPVYHGTDGDTLNRGVGHLMGSSLPVGGESTHAVLTGHSGLARDKLFTDLDRMEMGDVFMLHILHETLTYQVDSITTVLPDDTSALGIEQGQDLCTLITCTPYGVNSHRLLVRGHRIENLPEEEIAQQADETLSVTQSDWTDQYMHGVIVGIVIGVIALIVIVLYMMLHPQNPHRTVKTAPVNVSRLSRTRGRHDPL